MTMVRTIGGPAVPVRNPRGSRADGRFGAALDATQGGGEAHEAVATGSVFSASALLALQELPDATQRNRRARKAAEAALEGLKALQAALLGGGLDHAQLSTLAGVAARAAEAEDPSLREAAEAVALRAAVELARLEMAQAAQAEAAQAQTAV